MAFVPHLFVSIGATGAFYTLRETYEHEFFIGGKRFTESRSFHHCNLSQDADEAWQKARDASAQFAIPLSGTREGLDFEMREIKRADAEEMERREAQRKAWEEERAAMREAAFKEKIDRINSGFFAFGRFAGESFFSVPTDYLAWFVKNRDEFEAGSLTRHTADAILRLASDRLPIEPNATATVGSIGERVEINVTVSTVRQYQREAYGSYGMETVYITTMVSDNQVCVVVKSPSFNPQSGEKLRIKGTVKAHSEYRGQMQTVLQRVKVI